MSDTNPGTAEPTEPEPGGTAAQPAPDSAEVAAAEPTEPEPGGKQ